MSQTVIGIFDTEREAHSAFNDLLENKFSREDINLTFNKSQEQIRDSGIGISNFFRSIFGNKNQSDYSRVAYNGGAVITVRSDNMRSAELAQEILDDAGAINMDERLNNLPYNEPLAISEPLAINEPNALGASSNLLANTPVKRLSASSSPESLETSNIKQREIKKVPVFEKEETLTTRDQPLRMNQEILNSASLNDKNNLVIPVIREEMVVGKKAEVTGSTRLRSRIVERDVEENLALRSETIDIERNPVNRPASDQDFHAFHEGEIEFIETREIPVVSREARVVEEISIGKTTEERDETIKGKVRHTVVDVERTKPEP